MTPMEMFDRATVAAPAFGALVNEHYRDYGELLAHVLMADLLRFVGSHFTGNALPEAPPPTTREVNEILMVLDSAIATGSPDTENVIAVSFIENIEVEPFFEKLSPLLGANLRGELEKQKSWWRAR